MNEQSASEWVRELWLTFMVELEEVRRTAPHLFEHIRDHLSQHISREQLEQQLSVAQTQLDLEDYQRLYKPLEIREFQAHFKEIAERFKAYLHPESLQSDIAFFERYRTRLVNRKTRKESFDCELEMRITLMIKQQQRDVIKATRHQTLTHLQELLVQWRETLKLLQALSLKPTQSYHLYTEGYDLNEGLLQEHDFRLLKSFAELASSPAIQELLEELGRLRESEELTEERLLQEVDLIEHKRRVHFVKEEVSGVTLGDELQRALASELGLLQAETDDSQEQGSDEETDELLELLLYARMLNRSIAQYELVGVETRIVSQPITKPSPKLKSGPFIICVDTSGSMIGQPERVAKTLAFVLLRSALQQGRGCFLINFSTRIQTQDLSDITTSLSALLSFLKQSFHGGTDATPALQEALHQLQEERFKQADVLVVSDFAMPSLSAQLLNEIQTQKAKGTRFHSAIISDNSSQSTLPIFDSEWSFQEGWSSLIQGELLSKRTTAKDIDHVKT